MCGVQFKNWLETLKPSKGIPRSLLRTRRSNILEKLQGEVFKHSRLLACSPDSLQPWAAASWTQTMKRIMSSNRNSSPGGERISRLNLALLAVVTCVLLLQLSGWSRFSSNSSSCIHSINSIQHPIIVQSSPDDILAATRLASANATGQQNAAAGTAALGAPPYR